MNLLPRILTGSDDRRRAQIQRQILRHQAKVGGELFGPIPRGHRREFFCLDARTWVWHEEWLDDAKQRQIVTTTYTVRPGGVFKSQNNQSSRPVEGAELKNLYQAIRLYGERVPAELQRLINHG